MPIQDLAREEVVSARPDESVEELARRMDEESVGSVVITNGDQPVGIATDRDLTTRVLANGSSPDELTAGDVMTEQLCTVEAEAGFYRAAEIMRQNGVRRLPICDDDGELAGIITADDLSELLAEESEQIADIIRTQRPAY